MQKNKKVPADVKRKVRKLAELVHELRKGNQFNITKLTTIKSLCKEPEVAFSFVLYLAQLTQEKMNKLEPQHLSKTRWLVHKEKVKQGICQLRKYLENPNNQNRENLRVTWRELKELQNNYHNHKWNSVRIVDSSETLLVENALKCVLDPEQSSFWSYHVAREYAERYNPSYGTGLIPESAPLVEDIVMFWAQWYEIDPAFEQSKLPTKKEKLIKNT